MFKVSVLLCGSRKSRADVEMCALNSPTFGGPCTRSGKTVLWVIVSRILRDLLGKNSEHLGLLLTLQLLDVVVKNLSK